MIIPTALLVSRRKVHFNMPLIGRNLREVGSGVDWTTAKLMCTVVIHGAGYEKRVGE